MTQVRIGQKLYDRIEDDEQHVRYEECPAAPAPANEEHNATRPINTRRQLLVIGLVGLLLVTVAIMARVLAF